MAYWIIEVCTKNDREIKRTMTAMKYGDCYEALNVASEMSRLAEAKRAGIDYRVCPVLD